MVSSSAKYARAIELTCLRGAIEGAPTKPELVNNEPSSATAATAAALGGILPPMYHARC